MMPARVFTVVLWSLLTWRTAEAQVYPLQERTACLYQPLNLTGACPPDRRLVLRQLILARSRTSVPGGDCYTLTVQDQLTPSTTPMCCTYRPSDCSVTSHLPSRDTSDLGLLSGLVQACSDHSSGHCDLSDVNGDGVVKPFSFGACGQLTYVTTGFSCVPENQIIPSSLPAGGDTSVLFPEGVLSIFADSYGSPCGFFCSLYAPDFVNFTVSVLDLSGDLDQCTLTFSDGFPDVLACNDQRMFDFWKAPIYANTTNKMFVKVELQSATRQRVWLEVGARLGGVSSPLNVTCSTTSRPCLPPATPVTSPTEAAMSTKPPAPDPVEKFNVSAVTSSNVTLTWSRSNSGGVLNYSLSLQPCSNSSKLECPVCNKLTADVAGSVCQWEVQGNASDPVICGLDPYTHYSVSVLAYNAPGNGSVSTLSFNTSQSPPGEVQNLHQTFSNSSAASYDWQDPLHWNGIPVNFSITHEKQFESSGKEMQFHCSESCTWMYPYEEGVFGLISYNLPAFTTLTVSVTAINEAGPGVPSYLNVTTDQAPPSAVNFMNASKVSSSSMNVTWSKPRTPNGILRNYSVALDPCLKASLSCTTCFGNQPLETTDCNWIIDVVSDDNRVKVLLSNLEPFTQYAVTVAASTDAGFGNTTTLNVTTLESAPGPIQHLRQTASTASAVNLSWSAPSHRNGILQNYSIGLTPCSRNMSLVCLSCGASETVEGSPCQWTVPAGRTGTVEVQVASLAAFTTYTVSVAASSRAAAGSLSSLNITTDQAPPGAVSLLNVSNITATSMAVQWSRPQQANGVLQGYWLSLGPCPSHPSLTCPACLQVNNTNACKWSLAVDTVHDPIQLSLTSLQPFSQYDVTVAGVTSAGTGNDVTRHVATLESVPSPVRDLHVHDVLSHAAMLNWTPPATANGVIRGYHVILSRNCSPEVELVCSDCNVTDAAHCSWNVSQDQSQSFYDVQLSQLRPFTEYECNVTAFTLVGGSQPSSLAWKTGQWESGPIKNLRTSDVRSHSLTLSWQPPEEINGVPSNYVLSMAASCTSAVNMTCDNCNASYEASNCTLLVGRVTLSSYTVEVSGLRAYTAHTFTAALVNGHGTGQSSNVTVTTAESRSGPVTSMTVSTDAVTDRRSAEVTWRSPASPNGKVLYYVVSLSQGVTGCHANVTLSCDSCASNISDAPCGWRVAPGQRQGQVGVVLSRLTASTLYNVTVSPANSLGPGEATSLTFLSPSVESCPREEQETPRGVFSWPETEEGHVTSLQCPLGASSPGFVATRRCVRLVLELSWRPADVAGCIWKRATTQTLQELASQPINASTAHHVVRELANVTKQAATFARDDVTLSVDTALAVLQHVEVLQSRDVVVTMVTTISDLLTAPVNAVTSDSGTKLLSAIARISTATPLTNGSLLAVQPHLALAALALTPDLFQGVTFTAHTSSSLSGDSVSLSNQTSTQTDDVEGRTSISLPPTLLSSLPPNSTASRITFTLLQSHDVFYALQRGHNETAARGPGGDNSTVVVNRINSMVIAASVPGVRVVNLSDPVLISFSHKNKSASNPRCVYWEAGEARWGGEGCRVQSTGEQRTVCACDHLTHFALLMDLYQAGSRMSEKDRIALSYISFIGCGVSLAALVFTLVTFVVFKKLRKDFPPKIHANLCLALTLSDVIFVAGMHDYSMDNVIVCKGVAAVLHFSLLAALTWMGVEALHLCLALTLVYHTYRHRFLLKCSLLGWGVPLVIVAVTLGVGRTDNYGRLDSGICWLRTLPFFAAFVAPVLLIMTFNLLAFGLAVSKMIAATHARQDRTARKTSAARQVRGALGVMALLGLTWLFAIFAIGEANAVFSYLFAICNSLQGLFIFVFYCLANKDARAQWLRALSCCRRRRSSHPRSQGFNRSSSRSSSGQSTRETSFKTSL